MLGADSRSVISSSIMNAHGIRSSIIRLKIDKCEAVQATSFRHKTCPCHHWRNGAIHFHHSRKAMSRPQIAGNRSKAIPNAHNCFAIKPIRSLSLSRLMTNAFIPSLPFRSQGHHNLRPIFEPRFPIKTPTRRTHSVSGLERPESDCATTTVSAQRVHRKTVSSHGNPPHARRKRRDTRTSCVERPPSATFSKVADKQNILPVAKRRMRECIRSQSLRFCHMIPWPHVPRKTPPRCRSQDTQPS